MNTPDEARVERAEPIAPGKPGNGAAAEAGTAGRPVKRAFSVTWLVITGVAGLVSVVVSVLFQLAPGLRPDPGDNVGAEVAVVGLEPGTSVDGWIARGFVDNTQRGLRQRFKGQLEFPGEVILVRVAVDGHKHNDVVLRYRVYNAQTARAVPISWPHQSMRINAPSQRSVQAMFVPDLTDEGTVFIRVELWDREGLLSVSDSRPISRGRIEAVS